MATQEELESLERRFRELSAVVIRAGTPTLVRITAIHSMLENLQAQVVALKVETLVAKAVARQAQWEVTSPQRY